MGLILHVVKDQVMSHLPEPTRFTQYVLLFTESSSINISLLKGPQIYIRQNLTYTPAYIMCKVPQSL